MDSPDDKLLAQYAALLLALGPPPSLAPGNMNTLTERMVWNSDAYDWMRANMEGPIFIVMRNWLNEFHRWWNKEVRRGSG